METFIEENIRKNSEQKAAMIQYMLLKIQQEDWHAVADAAMDIREIVAKINTLNSMSGSFVILDTKTGDK